MISAQTLWHSGSFVWKVNFEKKNQQMTTKAWIVTHHVTDWFSLNYFTEAPTRMKMNVKCLRQSANNGKTQIWYFSLVIIS